MEHSPRHGKGRREKGTPAELRNPVKSGRVVSGSERAASTTAHKVRRHKGQGGKR